MAAVTERMKDREGILDIDVTHLLREARPQGHPHRQGRQHAEKDRHQAPGEDMERFFGCKVNLQLWVKVKEDWRQRPETLQSLGFSERDLEM